jgi:hypothetical protein
MCCRAYRKVEDASQNKESAGRDLTWDLLNRKQARCTFYGYLRGMMHYRILRTGSRKPKPCKSIPTDCRFCVSYSSHWDASVWTHDPCSIFKPRFSFNITRSKILYLFEQEEPLVTEILLHRGVNAISSFSVGQEPSRDYC